MKEATRMYISAGLLVVQMHTFERAPIISHSEINQISNIQVIKGQISL